MPALADLDGPGLMARVAALEPEARAEAARIMQELEDHRARRLFHALFPDWDTPWQGPSILKGLIEPGQIIHARAKYPRHLEFFEAGRVYRERCFMAANRVGKTLSGGGYELACHLTGHYPSWWPGRRFRHPISAWAAGRNNESTRDIVQTALLGQPSWDGARRIVDGRGVIPGDAIVRAPRWKSGVQDLVDTVQVRHVSGATSTLGFKSYEQGRGSFEGTGQHVIWLDEEPPMDVYGECLIRTATLNGLVMLTFTPLEGMSEVVLQFMPADQRPEAT